eukprot:scaffold7374_cov112-Isochrysis_galbana.AAC.3
MTPEDREPDAPDMSHAESHTPPRPCRRRAFRQDTGLFYDAMFPSSPVSNAKHRNNQLTLFQIRAARFSQGKVKCDGGGHRQEIRFVRSRTPVALL